MRTWTVALLLASFVPTASAQQGSSPWSVDLETGAIWFGLNDVAILGNTGTRFDFRQLTGDGPFAFARLQATYERDNGPGWRFLYAPLSVTDTGALSESIEFAGESFGPGTAEGTYRFNSYRLTYRNRWKQGPRSDWRVGFTMKVRDAEIAVRQGERRASKTNTGLVPLLHVYGEERLSGRWTFNLDLDLAAAPQGRAIDAGLRFLYAINPSTRLIMGYRILEGGADNGEVYNFSFIGYGTIGAQYRF